jgi:hypothetical protein
MIEDIWTKLEREKRSLKTADTADGQVNALIASAAENTYLIFAGT